MKRIDYVKIGRLTRIPRAALDRYIAAHTMRADENE
jgi:excisionase family DNA binding protein